MAPKSLEKSKIKFLLLEGIHPSAVEALNRAGYDNIELHKKALAPADLKATIANAHFVGIRSRTQLTQDIFVSALTRLTCRARSRPAWWSSTRRFPTPAMSLNWSLQNPFC